MKVQRRKDELLPPASVSETEISFEFDITVDIVEASLNFLGKYAQGPKDSRFVYVNSGTSAGQTNTECARRAKLSLMSITKKQIETILENRGSRLATTMPGIGRDGGPTCASVKGLEWKVVGK